MPTFKQPHDNPTLELPAWSPYYPAGVTAYIYLLAAVILPILAVVHLIIRRKRTSESSSSRLLHTSDAKHNLTQLPLGPAWEKQRHRFFSSFGPGPWRQRSGADPAPRFVPFSLASSHELQPQRKLFPMDGSDGELGEDHYPWSALAASRGVSTPSPKQHQAPFPTGPSSLTVTARSRRSRSPRASSQASPGKRHSGSSDGSRSRALKGKGKGPMVGHGHQVDGSPKTSDSDGEAETYGAQFLDGHPGSLRDSSLPGTNSTVPRHFSRPPPPPPLTPPALSAAAFPFEDRHRGYATSVPPALDLSFIHQPNPDYGASPTSTDALSSSPQTALPRRRSYTRSVPIGIPNASSSTDTDTATASEGSLLHNPFAPSSHPQASPFLPPPPPGHYNKNLPSAPPEYEFVGGPGGPGVEIDVQGEIISVVDDAGHGWKRHTRVYGGGVCLACLAAAERHGPGQGGFYGDKVPLEDRRDMHMHMQSRPDLGLSPGSGVDVGR